MVLQLGRRKKRPGSTLLGLSFRHTHPRLQGFFQSCTFELVSKLVLQMTPASQHSRQICTFSHKGTEKFSKSCEIYSNHPETIKYFVTTLDQHQERAFSLLNVAEYNLSKVRFKPEQSAVSPFTVSDLRGCPLENCRASVALHYTCSTAS